MTAPRQTCRRCGRTLQARDAEGLSGEQICARCRRFLEEESGPQVDPRSARQEDAADFLSSLGGTRFEGQRLSRWGIFAVGIAAALVGTCAGFLGVLAIYAQDAELPAAFAGGMLGLAGVCLVITLACFVPRSRSWALPLLAVIIGVLIVVLRRRW